MVFSRVSLRLNYQLGKCLFFDTCIRFKVFFSFDKTHYETYYYNKMHFGFGIIAKVAVIIIEIQIFSTIESIFNN